MILPIITAISREVFAADAAPARGGRARARRDPLGDDPATRSSPTPAPAWSPRVMLGLGRALGETMAVAMVLSRHAA